MQNNNNNNNKSNNVSTLSTSIFPDGWVVKNLPANAGYTGLIPATGRFP